MKMPGALAAAKREHWMGSFEWLGYTLIGAVPFWGVALIFWLRVQAMSIDIFVKDAQLAIYSAGLLAAAIPVMLRDIKGSPFKQPKWFLFLSLVVLLVAAIVFGSVAAGETTVVAIPGQSAEALAQRQVQIRDRILLVSIALALVTYLLCFFTELINSIRIEPDLQRVRTEDEQALGKRVRKKLDEMP